MNPSTVAAILIALVMALVVRPIQRSRRKTVIVPPLVCRDMRQEAQQGRLKDGSQVRPERKVMTNKPLGPLQLPVPTVKVVALGGSGSGKTVLLSSMFHELSIQLPERRFFLDCDMEQRRALSGVHAEVAQTDHDWPAGTMRGQTREFVFDCASWTDDRTRVVAMKINYLEYAGEFLDGSAPVEPDSAKLGDLQRRINEADALFGIFDGRRLLQYLNGEPDGRMYMQATIRPILGQLCSRIGPSRPLYFLITKWDLFNAYGPALADENSKLAYLGKALTDDPAVSALLSSHPVRLIPVSAVGPDFARVDASSGQMVKQPGAHVRPLNVGVPLAAVVPDLIDRLRAGTDAAVQAAIDNELRALRRRGPIGWLGECAAALAQPMGGSLRYAIDSVFGTYTDTTTVTLLLQWLGASANDNREDVNQRRNEAEVLAATLEHARATVLAEFRNTVRQLERDLPASRLSGGNWS
jgi:hypothetical protein